MAGSNAMASLFASRRRSFSGPDGLLDFEHFEVGPRHVFEPSEGRTEIGSHPRRLPLSLDRPCSLPPSLAQIRCWMIGRTTPRPRCSSRRRRSVMKIMPYLGMSSRHGLCQLHLEYHKMIKPSINSDRHGPRDLRGIFGGCLVVAMYGYNRGVRFSEQIRMAQMAANCPAWMPRQ